MTLESNQELIQGAEVLAAGRTLGMTDDETISLRNQTRRRQQRERRAQRGTREQNRATAEEFLRADERAFEAKGRYGSQIDDEAFAFGEDPTYMGGGRRPQDDEQSYDRGEKIRNDALADEFYTDAEVAEQLEGRSREKPSDANVKGGISDALNRLREGKNRFAPGYEAFGTDAEVMAALDRRLEGELSGGIQTEADRRQAQRAVREDARLRRGDLTAEEANARISRTIRGARPEGGTKGGARFDRDVELAARLSEEIAGRREAGQRGVPEMVALQNDNRAAREAAIIRNRFGGLPRQLADADIGRINEIRSLGGAMPFASHDAVGNFQVVQAINPAEFGQAIPLTDKDGRVREYYGYEDKNLVQLGEVNIDSSDQVLNAPKPTPGQEFISQNLPSYGREGGTTFGYPQVGINDEMALLGDRIRGLKGYGYENIGNPRTLADFETAMGAIVARGQNQGDTFYRFNPETRKTIAVAEPTVNDVLYKLGYTDADRQRLANALYQGEAASKVDINQADKQAFSGRTERPTRTGFPESVNLRTGETRSPVRDDLAMNVAEMRPDGGLALAKIKNEKVGRGKKAKSVKAGLAGISEEALINSLRDSGMLTDERGNLMPEAARMIEGARLAREDAQRPLIGALASEKAPRAAFIRGKDRGRSEASLAQQYGPENAAVAAKIEERYLADRARREASIVGRTPFRNDMDDQFFSQAFARNAEASRRPVQPTQEAPVASSIAPDPGVMTGNQAAPIADAGAGRTQGPTRPMTEEMRRELFSLPGLYKKEYMAKPEGPERQADAYVKRARKDLEEFRTSPKYQRGRRIAYGAGGGAAALASVLGLSNMNKEEEEQL